MRSLFSLPPRIRTLAVGLAMLAAHSADAATGSNILPWENPLALIASRLTGPVALSFSLVGMAAAGYTLLFGGEISEFTRKAVLLVMAISFLIFGAGFMSALFGVSGALV